EKKIVPFAKLNLQVSSSNGESAEDHEDYVNIKEALEVMRGVAIMFNEHKRRMETLEKLAGWKQSSGGKDNVCRY
ncbi:hypothetical protein GWI33_016218, partial [Rhynchophorus ferrugineus]